MNINNTLQAIDFIGLINLITRDDRLFSVLNEFNKHDIDTNNITILRPEKHYLGGAFGCYCSHLKLYKKAIENNARYALILEDDFRFIDESTEKIIEKLNICINFINKNKKNWDILKITDDYLLYIKNRINNNIYNTVQASTQGYFINRHCMEKMLDHGILMFENEGFHIDLAQIIYYNFKIYTIMPEIIQCADNALNNDNTLTLPKMLLKHSINILNSNYFIECCIKLASYEQNHVLCKMLADLNMYNVSDIMIYCNVFVTSFIGIIVYLNKYKTNKTPNILVYIITSIIITYILIIVEHLFIQQSFCNWVDIVSMYKLNKIPNPETYNTDNNISEFVLK